MATRQLGNLEICCVSLALIAVAGANGMGAQEDFMLHKVMDTNGSGELAITYKIPQGWIAQDNIYWNLSLRINPMSFAMTTASADQQELVSYLSALTFDFASNGFGMAGKAPPAQPSDFLMENFQAVHPNAQYEVVDRQDIPIPFPYKPAAQNVSTHAFHSVLKIRFNAGGIPSVETLSVDYYGYSQPMGAGYHGNWIADGLTTVVSPEDEQADAAQLSHQILSSAKMTPAFLAKYKQVTTMLQAKTKAEARAAEIRAHRVVVTHYVGGGGYGGYSPSRVMDKDTFILHEAIKGLRSRIFSRSIGN